MNIHGESPVGSPGGHTPSLLINDTVATLVMCMCVRVRACVGMYVGVSMRAGECMLLPFLHLPRAGKLPGVVLTGRR